MDDFKGYSENADNKRSITFMPIVMNEDTFSLKIKALYSEIKKGMVMNVILFDKDSKRKLLSQSFICREQNEITGEIKNNIPSRKTGYMVAAKVLSSDSSVLLNDSKEYVIEDETGLLSIEASEPVSKFNNKEVVVVNDSNIGGDYIYSKNAVYINQDQVHTLDIFLPAKITLCSNNDYKINKIIDYKLTLTDTNRNSFLYCGNRKFNKIILRKDRKSCSISFFKEWKNHIQCKNYDNTEALFKLNLWVQAELEYTGDDKYIEGIRNISWSTETITEKAFLPIKLTWSNYD